MKKDAKIGLGIILCAVLLSALLVGKALQKRDVRPVKIPDAVEVAKDATKPAEAEDGASEGGSAMDRLTSDAAADRDAEGGAAAGEDDEGSLADSGGAESPGGTASEAPLLAGNVPDEGASPAGSEDTGAPAGDRATGTGGAADAGGEDEAIGGWAPATGGTGAPSADAPAAPAAPAAGSDFRYTVQAGDSAWKLAKRFYGDGRQYRRIVKANPAVKFASLKVGTELTIPGRAGGSSASAPSARAEEAAAPAGVRVHRVRAGDSPYKLARKYLGSGMRYQEILDLNPGVDPNRLKIGQKLKIPAR